jgi:hypothetical protein
MTMDRDTLTLNIPAKAAWMAAIGTLVTATGMIFFAGVAWETLQTVQATQAAMVRRADADHELLARHDEALRIRGIFNVQAESNHPRTP